MGRKIAIAMMTAGTLAVGTSLYVQNRRFSNEAIWQRQKPRIEQTFADNENAASAKFGELRTGLARLKEASLPERCRYEKTFEAVLENGSPEAAEEKINRESFRPHPECEGFSQIKESVQNWHGKAGAAGLLAMLAGAVLFVRSFFKKDELRV